MIAGPISARLSFFGGYMIICITSTGKVQKQLIYDLIEDAFMPYAGKELTLDDEERDLVCQIQAAEVPVYDLARALSPVMPLERAESHAEALPDPSEGDPVLEESEAVELISECLLGEDFIRAEWIRYFDKLSLAELKGIEEELHNAIKVRETFTEYRNGTRFAEKGPDYTDKGSVPEGIDRTIKYYKSPAGKMRKAGPRSKPRPKEEVVYLTPEEESALE